jgi:hypothetical protein
MAASFDARLSIREPPAEAQSRAATALVDPARAVGLRLTKREAGELVYRPRVQFPFLLMLWHYLSGERMTVRFEPGEAGGTQVTIRGSVARDRHPLASDPEHWAEALGANAAPEGGTARRG